VEKELDKEVDKPMIMPSDYLMCRFSPFDKMKGKGYIPDGRGKNIVLRDYKTTYDITVTDPASIRISPMWPYPVRFHCATGGSMTVNGTVLTFNYAPAITAIQSQTLGAVLPTNMSRAQPFFGGSPSGASHVAGRVVTVGYRLYYTGAAAQASGLILVDNLPWSADNITNANPAATVVKGISGQADITCTVGQGPTLAVDVVPFEVIQSSPTTDQVVLRPENGCHGILKSQGTSYDHPYQPMQDTPVLPVTYFDGGTITPQPIYVNTPGTVLATIPALGFVDQSFMEANIQITGAGNQPYRLEVVFCCELEVGQDSPILDMSTNSPPLNQAELNTAQILNSGIAPANFAESPIESLIPRMQGVRLGQRVRRRRKNVARNPQPQQQQRAKKSTPAKTARRRRNRQRRAARALQC